MGTSGLARRHDAARGAGAAEAELPGRAEWSRDQRRSYISSGHCAHQAVVARLSDALQSE